MRAMGSGGFQGFEDVGGLLEAAQGRGFECGVFANGSAGGGIASGEVVEGFGVEFIPAAFDGLAVLGQFDVDGGGFEVTDAHGAPEVADEVLGEEALEVVGGLEDGVDGLADEGKDGGVLEIEEDAGVAVGEQGMIGLALGGAGLRGLRA